MNSSLQPCTAMWDCGMTPAAGCKRVFSSAWYSIYSVDRASDLVWENLLLVPQRDKIHQHHYWSYLYTIGFACKYASYCATSKILFGWLQFRWDYKHHHIISRVVLGFSSFTVLSLGSITSAHVAFTRTTCSFSLLCSQPFLPFGCFLRSICTFFSTEVLSVRVPGGCRSNGWHGYCPGSLVAPFRITRQYLPHGFNLIFIEGIKKRAFLPKATKKST